MSLTVVNDYFFKSDGDVEEGKAAPGVGRNRNHRAGGRPDRAALWRNNFTRVDKRVKACAMYPTGSIVGTELALEA